MINTHQQRVEKLRRREEYLSRKTTNWVLAQKLNLSSFGTTLLVAIGVFTMFQLGIAAFMVYQGVLLNQDKTHALSSGWGFILLVASIISVVATIKSLVDRPAIKANRELDDKIIRTHGLTFSAEFNERIAWIRYVNLVRVVIVLGAFSFFMFAVLQRAIF